MGHSDRCGICHARGSRKVLSVADLSGKAPLPVGTIVCGTCQTRVFPPQRAGASPASVAMAVRGGRKAPGTNR